MSWIKGKYSNVVFNSSRYNNSNNFQTSLGYTQLFFPTFVLASGIALSIVITLIERILIYRSKTTWIKMKLKQDTINIQHIWNSVQFPSFRKFLFLGKLERIWNIIFDWVILSLFNYGNNLWKNVYRLVK